MLAGQRSVRGSRGSVSDNSPTRVDDTLSQVPSAMTSRMSCLRLVLGPLPCARTNNFWHSEVRTEGIACSGPRSAVCRVRSDRLLSLLQPRGQSSLLEASFTWRRLYRIYGKVSVRRGFSGGNQARLHPLSGAGPCRRVLRIQSRYCAYLANPMQDIKALRTAQRSSLPRDLTGITPGEGLELERLPGAPFGARWGFRFVNSINF